MEWIFLIVLIGALTYVGVELTKHFFPSYSDKMWEAEQKVRTNYNALIEEIHQAIVGKKGDQ